MFKLLEILKYLVITIVSLISIYFIANYFIADSMKAKYEKHLNQLGHDLNPKEILGKADLVKAPETKNQ